jgi:hypothetical protein
MKTIHIILCSIALAYAGIYAHAQNPSDSVRVTYKNKTVVVKPQGDESYTTIKFKDTGINKKIVVKVAILDNYEIAEKKIEDKLDTTSKKVYNMLKNNKPGERKHFIETSFFSTFDLGLSSTINEVDQNTFNPKIGKSINMNIGLVRQNMNLLKGQFLLSYGLSLNNYYLKYDNKQMLQKLDQQGYLVGAKDSVNTYSKNRLDVRYFTIPVLVEYHSKSDNFRIAAGVELGFNGKSKYVLKGENNGSNFNNKSEVDIKINPSQLNAVVRIGIDNIAIYGKYSISDMYQNSSYSMNQNPHQHLYSVGICFFGI